MWLNLAWNLRFFSVVDFMSSSEIVREVVLSCVNHTPGKATDNRKFCWHHQNLKLIRYIFSTGYQWENPYRAKWTLTVFLFEICYTYDILPLAHLPNRYKLSRQLLPLYWSTWVRSRNCGCLVTWFCYQLIAKPGNKTDTVSWPDPHL